MAVNDVILEFSAWDYVPANSNPAISDTIADGTADFRGIAFDKTTNKVAVFSRPFKSTFTSGKDLTVEIKAVMASAISGDVDIEIQFAKLEGITFGSITFDTITAISNTNVPTSAALTEFEITGTIPNANIDGCVANDDCAVLIRRRQDTDTASGDMIIKEIKFIEAA